VTYTERYDYFGERNFSEEIICQCQTFLLHTISHLINAFKHKKITEFNFIKFSLIILCIAVASKFDFTKICKCNQVIYNKIFTSTLRTRTN
jgi:hypothetical protein